MAPPALIVLTGPSHSGKSSIARALADELDAPSAWVAIDSIVGTLSLAPAEDLGAVWEKGLPIAYEIAEATASVLLRRGVTVLLESTLTFIPVDGRAPEFHSKQLERFAAIAAEHGAQLAVVRITAELEELLRRRAVTGRLTDAVIEGTWRQHRDNPLPAAVELDATGEDVATLTGRVAALLRERGQPPTV